jgi:hypothetical protein
MLIFIIKECAPNCRHWRNVGVIDDDWAGEPEDILHAVHCCEGSDCSRKLFYYSACRKKESAAERSVNVVLLKSFGNGSSFGVRNF